MEILSKTNIYTKFKDRKQADPETKPVASNIENCRIHTQAKIGVPIRKITGTFKIRMDTCKENRQIHTQRARHIYKRIQIPGGQNGQNAGYSLQISCKTYAKRRLILDTVNAGIHSRLEEFIIVLYYMKGGSRGIHYSFQAT